MDHTLMDSFSPKDFQVELFEAAKLRNTIACMNSGAGKTFIAVMLIREKALEVCGTFRIDSDVYRTVYLTPTISLAVQQSAYLRHHTPLKVGIFHYKKGISLWNSEKWLEELDKHQVLVMTYSVFLDVVLLKGYLKMSQINLLILDECHNIVRDSSLKSILEAYENSNSLKPRILGLTTSIVNKKCKPTNLANLIINLESTLQSVLQTSNSILSALQHAIQPREIICEISPNPSVTDLEELIFDRVNRAFNFLRLHRYDPTEYYGPQDYLNEIPNPCSEPLAVLEEFIEIIHTFGPWGADRAAVIYLIQLEKLKTRAVYERHYLLLCLVYTTLLEIRSLCEEVFQKFTEYERIEKFSRPKVLRLLEILRIYRPQTTVKSNVSNEEQDQIVNSNHEETSTVETIVSPQCPSAQQKPQTFVPLVNVTRRRRPDFSARHYRNRDDLHQLCGIIFAEKRNTAKLLYHLLKDASRCDPQLAYLSPLYTVGHTESMTVKETENEERKQEEVMKRFRSRDCNILVATSILEDGIDLPACHLVIRFDLPQSYKAYVHSKARARARNSHFILMVEHEKVSRFLDDLAQFHGTEQILLGKSGYQNSVTESQFFTEEMVNNIQSVYQPSESSRCSLLNSIGIINRYCAKLPSDCFTRLTPIWEIRTVPLSDIDGSIREKWALSPLSTTEKTLSCGFLCSLQLPINSPLRQTIHGLPMPSKALAKRSVALETCRLLHKLKELDDNFYPIGKENLRLEEEEDYNAELEEENVPESSPRPGTTKRRQYYYKQVADAFTNCAPKSTEVCYLYAISMVLTEPIPEEQNTRGRKIYKPETSQQLLGLLSSKPISQICPFPIFTRSGEVEVDIVLVAQDVLIDKEQLNRIADFQRYIFQSVLALEKDPMVFDVFSADCSYLIVPLRRVAESRELKLDFKFIDLISSVRNAKPTFIPDEDRRGYMFDPRKFLDTVVMRWYRDQEHPQCFYVAEIFYELNPQSKFPDNNYPTFEKYYHDKYGIQIQNLNQPLLDVDHTSARLNFLTPRYVNRKGVMLPTSSEHTKKTQRESLQQKQILVPELCSIHPFSASLWRQTVCLPCILYRLNGLLLAEKLRCQVAAEMALGKVTLLPDFHWPPLRFGWKRKTAINAITAPVAVDEKIASISNEELQAPSTSADESVKPSDPIIKPSRKAPKEGKKHSGSAMMDIGVWNPDAIGDINQPSVNEEGAEEYDYNDLQAVALLTNENVADFDWNKPILDPATSTGPLPTFKVGTSDQPWMEDSNNIGQFSQFRPRSPSEFVDNNYSDCGSYNSDQSCADDSDSDCLDEPDEDNSCKVKEFGPKLVFKGDTAEAVEEPYNNKLKKMKSPEEEEIEEGLVIDEETYEHIEDLFSLNWEWKGEQANQDLEEKCEKLLNLHKEFLMKESFVPFQNTNIPVVPPFLPKPEKRVEGDCDVQENVISRSEKSCSESSRLASESQHMMEMTKLLLGSLKDSKNDEVAPYNEILSTSVEIGRTKQYPVASDALKELNSETISFSFDEQPDLENHSGPSPSVILQAFTMSSANDGINLERLETIGDSFLKYSITSYLFCKYSHIHEGKLSYLRSRQVSNLHLYQLGKKKLLGGCMVATKFNPHDNWLPPGYVIPDALEESLILSGVPLGFWNVVDLSGMEQMSSEQVKALVKEKTDQILLRFGGKIPSIEEMTCESNISLAQDLPRFVPYNLLTQHSIPDKSIADCVEALIGAYLTACGPRGALLFMSWLGLKVLPRNDNGSFGHWSAPISPMVNKPFDADLMLDHMLAGFDSFEEKIGYKFENRFYLLQAFSHASYYPNRLTDCYQRLEFLGDAVLDYLITRYLYEDPRQHPPGALTDLRSALVNNTTFAVLAVRHEFHRYFKHFSSTLNQIMDKFIKAQEENGHCINEEYYLIEEGESEEAEDVEVPKALGDVFESVAGAIYLDSHMSLDAVWKVYYRMMRNEIDEFSKNVPKSPIRELLELETDRVKFGKAERLPDGRVRVTVDVIGKGTFKGIGRNYRIAKCTAAKFALRTLEKRKLLSKRGEQ